MMRLSVFMLCSLMAVTSHLASAKERFQQPGPVHLDKKGEKWARESLKKMSLEQKIGQMFMIWAQADFMNIVSPEYTALRNTMRKYHIGGFGVTVSYENGLLSKTPPLETAMLTNQLQSDSEFPLIFAADFERGLAFRLGEVTNFPHAMAFGATGDPELAREAGRITAREARAIGVQWNWFPDSDVNSNPENPVINTRSFGEDPKRVSEMVTAYIQGAHEFGMLTTAKHFPGHGDTDIDSHLAVPLIRGDKPHLESVELPPFAAAIQAGVDAVMVAHVVVPALDSDPNHVATISPAIVSGVLKQQMGFNGLVITDALNMRALMKLFPEGGSVAAGRAAVEAVKAGDDILLLPPDLEGAYNGLLQAVRSGEIPESRIDESVLKILRAKASVGLNKATPVDINAVNHIVASPASQATAQEIADEAVALVRDNHQVLPLKVTAKGATTPVHANPARTGDPGTNPAQNSYQSTVENRASTLALIFTPDLRSDAGLILEKELRARISGAKVMYIDPHNAAFLASLVMDAVEQAKVVIAAAYLGPQAGAPTNTSVLQNAQAMLLQDVVQKAAEKTVVVAMGNPYIAAQLPEVQTYMCTFSDAEVSEVSAVKAMFGEIPMPGRLPVTIPNIANRGTGLGVRPAVAAKALSSTGGPQ
jgi:beta-N-acetylhexosaminidase